MTARKKTPELSRDLQTIVAAAQWITSSPATTTWRADKGNFGTVDEPDYASYFIEQAASTLEGDFGSGPKPTRGIYFGRTVRHSVEDGRVLDSGGNFALVNFADPKSAWDHVPTIAGQRLHERTAVDVAVLSQMQEETLRRMAANALALATHYNVQLAL